MLLLLLVVLCYSGGSRGEILIERVEIVSQLNASLDTSHRLVSQKFTDILPQIPLLAGADDFMLPANISDNITILSLSFYIVRQFRDSDPDAITVSLMYNDATIEGPGQVFFTKSVRAPNNPPRWHNDSVGRIEVITLNITQNEQSSSDPAVYFDFTNTKWLPRQTRLWLSMYVTGTRSYDTAPPNAENVLFWCMTTTTTIATNAPYFFRDSENIMGRGFINWTNASMVEKALNFKSPSRNMAWSVALLGVAPSTFLEMLQGMDTKKMIAVVVCSIIGVLFMCGCVLCICKRCRRCRRKSPPIEYIDLNHYPPSSSPPLYPPPQHDDSVTYSEISLDNAHTLKSTPSGRYLENATHIPVKTRNKADKDK